MNFCSTVDEKFSRAERRIFQSMAPPLDLDNAPGMNTVGGVPIAVEIAARLPVIQ